jgi:GntR family transcriptional regulator
MSGQEMEEKAQGEALDRGQVYVGIEHLVLAALRDLDRPFGRRLLRLGCDPRRVYETIEAPYPATGSKQVARRELERRGRLPMTNHARQLLAAARTEAARRSAASVRSEHILIALLESERELRDIVEEQGLTRAIVLAALAEGGAVAGPPFRVTLDDSSDVPLFEQIVQSVEEGMATRRLTVGDRLPTVRRLADRLEIAPGTVARAYSILERRGLIETDGTRGTRVAAVSANETRAAASPVGAELADALRRTVIAAFHAGFTASALREALNRAMDGVYRT